MLAVAAVLGPLWLALAGPAAAHATLVSSTPAEGAVLEEVPDAAELVFDEGVSLPPRGVQVYDARGEPVASTASTSGSTLTVDLPGSLADGSYVVVWRVVSADGHPVSGSLTFSIGAPSAEVVTPGEPPSSGAGVRGLLGVLQAASVAGLLLAGGLVLFGALVLRGRGTDLVAERVFAVLGPAAMVALLCTVAVAPVAALYQQGLPLADLATSAPFAWSLVRDQLLVALLVGLGLGTAVWLSRPTRTTTGRHTRGALGAAAVAVAAPALVGHTRAFTPEPLLLVTDAAHLLVGAAWFGGLVGLAIALRTVGGNPRASADLLTRFSTVAAVALGVLVATGSLQAWRIVQTWQNLFETAYGRLLMVKVGVAVLVALVAAWNRWRLLPATSTAVGHQARQRAVHAVRRAVQVEAALLVVVVAVTGFLVGASPRVTVDEPDGSTGAQSAVAGDLKVLGVMAPREAGRENRVRIQVQDASGEPVDPPRPPVVNVRSGDAGGEGVDLGVVPVENVDAGTYQADVLVPRPGTWEVQVSIAMGEFENPVVTLSFEVGDPPRR